MLADGAARGVPGEMGAIDAKRVHQSQQIPRHIAHIGDDRPRARPTDPTMIVQDHTEVLGKLWYLLRPEPTAAAEARDQQQWLALAVLLDMQLGVADRHASTHGLATDTRIEILYVHLKDCRDSTILPANALWPCSHAPALWHIAPIRLSRPGRQLLNVI